MVDFYLVSYLSSLGLAILTLIFLIFVLKNRSIKCKFKVLPKALRLYLLVCCFPFIILINLASILSATNYLIFQSEKTTFGQAILYMVSLSSQQIRTSLFWIIIERIVSTIYLEKYKLSSSCSLFWYLTIWSYASTTAYMVVRILTYTVPVFMENSFILLWVMFFTHVFTLIVCTILYILNKQMYKLTAYHVTLQRRYQIFENVKVLSYLFTPILIFTLIAPFGSILTISFNSIYGYFMPYSIFHTFYNLSFFFILVYLQWFQKSHPSLTKNATSIGVISPFGQELPVIMSSEKYFQTLQLQWN